MNMIFENGVSDFIAKDDEYHKISSEETNGVCSYQNTKPLRLLSPTISSGRRKRRRPKKLATLRRYRHLDDSDEEILTGSSHELSDYSKNDITECHGMEKYTTHTSNVGTTYNHVEEYPVMIIGENEGEVSITENQSSSAEPTRPSASMSISVAVKLDYNGNEITNECSSDTGVPRISNIKSQKKEISYPRIKYTLPLVTREERNFHSNISSAPYFTEQSNMRTLTAASNPYSYSLIKHSQDHKVKESLPVMYHPRPHHMVNDSSSTHPYYLIADPRSAIKTENSSYINSVQLSPDTKPSSLLLKVSGSDGNSPGSSYLPKTRISKPFPVASQNLSVSSKNDVKPPKETPPTYLTIDGEQRPQCPECFQTFKKRAALERHMMIHRGIKPFQCHFCNQRFRQKHHLQGHIMLHTGERPHSCSLCNKRFRMRHHLLEHERISHKVFR